MCEFFSVGKTHPHAGVSKKRTKIPFLIGTGTNKTKKKHPLPMKKHKTTSKTPFRKLHVSTPPLLTLYSTSATALLAQFQNPHRERRFRVSFVIFYRYFMN
jgi:hypothetical protein